MENKEPLFDFLEDVVGQLEVKPTEQARELHLKAMNQQLMVQANQLSRRRMLKGLGGALMIAVVLGGLIWFFFNYLDQNSQQPQTQSYTTISQNPTNSAGNTTEQTSPLSKTSGTNTYSGSNSKSIQKEDQKASTNTLATTNLNKDNNPSQSNLHTSSSTTISQHLSSSNIVSSPSKSTSFTSADAKQPTFLYENNQETKTGLGTTQNNNLRPKYDTRLPARQAKFDLLNAKIKQKKSSHLKLAPLKFRPSDTLVETNKPNIKARNTFTDFAIGAHYTPEFMFNTLDQSNKLVNNAGLEVAWVKGPYSIRTGIGISIATGVTALGYNYNDFLGMTKKLDSVAFTYDAQGRKIIPSWYYSDKMVYDTALLTLTNEITKRYTYLQFPLILGYDFHQGKKLAFGFRAGPILQVLIDEKGLNSDPGAGDNLVVSINQLTPDRMATHWQALLGINSSLMLSKRFKLELEPHLKYYFNSVYEKTATTSKPWSVELRTALIIKL